MTNTEGAFYTKEYRNVFKELGFSEEEIIKKVQAAFNEMFLWGKRQKNISYIR